MISLHGAYYPPNYGDVLILDIEAKWVEEITGKKVALPFATNIYRKQIDVNQAQGKESIEKSEYLIYGSGGFLGEPPMSKFKWSLNFVRNHLKPALIANRNHVPYSIVGTGVGPISTFFGRMALRYIAKNAETITVRDDESRNYLINEIDSNLKVDVAADVALSLSKDEIPLEVRQKVREEYLAFDGAKIGVHIGADRFNDETGANVQLIIDDTVQFFNENTHLTPVIIIDNENAVQMEVSEYLTKQFKGNSVVFKYKDLTETTAMLAELDSVITNKLHIGIVNYAMGNIPLSFPYHTKTKRFYKQIDLEHLCTPIPDAEKGQLYEKLNMIHKDIQNDNKHLYQTKRDEMKEKALMNKENLRKVLS